MINLKKKKKIHVKGRVILAVAETLCLCVISTFTKRRGEQQCSTQINVLAAMQHTRGWIIYIRCQGLSLAHHNISPQPMFLQEDCTTNDCMLLDLHTTCSFVPCLTDLKSEWRKQEFRFRWLTCLQPRLNHLWVLQVGCWRWGNWWIPSTHACLTASSAWLTV